MEPRHPGVEYEANVRSGGRVKHPSSTHSLGRGAAIGSLEPGKQADFVIHDCRDYREIAYFAGIEPAASVYLRGELVFQR